MRWLWRDPDGGKESNSRMYGLEIKSLFSILVLRIQGETRKVFHNHAFNAISWILKGSLWENQKQGVDFIHLPSIKPIFTSRATTHQVEPWDEEKTVWALHLRGPWKKQWNEFDYDENKVTLTHGRKVTNA